MSLAQFDAKAAAGLFRTVTAASIDGRGRFPGAVSTARRHLRRQGAHSGLPVAAASDQPAEPEVEEFGEPGGAEIPEDFGADHAVGGPPPAIELDRVIRDVVEQHVRLAGAQGFVTSLGGFAVLPLALPANITGLAVLQTRMVAAIAFLHGYDVADPRVRTAIVACLFGEDAVGQLVRKGRLPYGPHGIATAAEHDPDLEGKVATLLGTALTARVSGKRLGIAVSRRVPLLGGGVGAVTDAVSTYKVGRFAERELYDLHQNPMLTPTSEDGGAADTIDSATDSHVLT